jgi:hypothetical protein
MRYLRARLKSGAALTSTIRGRWKTCFRSATPSEFNAAPLFRRALIALCALGLLVNCAGLSHNSGDLPQTVDLEFKGQSGETTFSRYYSNARILTFEQSQLVKDRQEAVDFLVRSRYSGYDSKSKVMQFAVKTMNKDGTVDLHELAFPELGEQIDYVVRSNGEVLRAGGFPPHSIFYVPSMPIAGKPVHVGDTWTMSHTWLSGKDGIPLKLDVVGILKNIVTCEKNKVCADVEVSGDVTVMAMPTAKGVRFSSRLWGRLLFSVERGDVIWSEMRSREDSGIEGDMVSVSSCMVSEMKMSDKYHIPFVCDPKEQPVVSVPAL